MRIGVIGTGTIGGMLASAFAESAPVWVYNRTWKKAAELAKTHANVHVASSVEQLARISQVVFLCTKAGDGEQVLRNIGGLLSPGQILATTISQVPMAEWEARTPAAIVKVIPSVTQLERSGIILVSYGSRFRQKDSEMFEELLCRIGAPFPVEDAYLRVCADLTSCGPAFFAFLLQLWAETAAKQAIRGHHGPSVAEMEHLLCATLSGVAKLFARGLSPKEIVARVCVPGGVTEAGIRAIEEEARHMFQRLHEATASHRNGSATASVGG
ncbi:MAG: NAD(P)-binding domain-containing protein [Alicyclobacillaceae bacterium]|nr:NAD(P)-binding domain-containing protein [Alicyclobacillaceae bacterium]